jgi:hypothetical protein
MRVVLAWIRLLRCPTLLPNALSQNTRLTMSTTQRKTGTVAAYDPDSAYGAVEVEGKRIGFHATCFTAVGPPARLAKARRSRSCSTSVALLSKFVAFDVVRLAARNR